MERGISFSQGPLAENALPPAPLCTHWKLQVRFAGTIWKAGMGVTQTVLQLTGGAKQYLQIFVSSKGRAPGHAGVHVAPGKFWARFLAHLMVLKTGSTGVQRIIFLSCTVGKQPPEVLYSPSNTGIWGVGRALDRILGRVTCVICKGDADYLIFSPPGDGWKNQTGNCKTILRIIEKGVK